MAKRSSHNDLLENVKRIEKLSIDIEKIKEDYFKERDFNKILIDSAPAFYVAISPEGKTIMMNQAMLSALGYASEEVVGKEYITNFIPECDRELVNQTFEKRKTSQEPTINLENQVICKNGRKLLVEWHGRSIWKPNGELDFFFGVGIDITKRRAAETRLKKAYKEIKVLKDRLEAENTYLREKIKVSSGQIKIIGKSQAIQKVIHEIAQVANTDSTVLILGETGTGKELVADVLHYEGTRSPRPFIKVNCSALAETILESELFGHVIGAFSGAVTNKIGRIQAAEGGTIFLDEIGEISRRIQVKLLRFLDNKEYERVGDSKTSKADVRIIAATNADLKKKVAEGTFRSDLFYRLNIMVIRLPLLKEREGDIPLLLNHFISHYGDVLHKEIQGVDEGVMKILLEYPWPGNVREFKHAIEHACLLCRGKLIRTRHLPLELQKPQNEVFNFKRTEPPQEASQILEALKKSRWNKTKAAQLLGVHRSTLYRLMDRYQIGDCF